MHFPVAGWRRSKGGCVAGTRQGARDSVGSGQESSIAAGGRAVVALHSRDTGVKVWAAVGGREPWNRGTARDRAGGVWDVYCPGGVDWTLGTRALKRHDVTSGLSQPTFEL